MLKKVAMKPVKGYIVTLELMCAVLIWCALCTATVWVINNQRWQKLMYTSFCSAATQTAKWGGTDTNIMKANGRTEDIAKSMERNINNVYPGAAVRIKITPTKVKATSPDNVITVELTWTPVVGAWGGLFNSAGLAGRQRTIRGRFIPIAKPGDLL